VCADLSFLNAECRVICVYRKPGFSATDLNYMSECVRCLQRLCATERLTIIAGDCNLPDIDWSCYSGPNTAIYDAFLNFVNSCTASISMYKDLHEIIIFSIYLWQLVIHF